MYMEIVHSSYGVMCAVSKINMMWCLFFFVLGFLTDKIRIFPFVLGIVLGIILKSLSDNRSTFDIHDVALSSKQMYHDFLTQYQGTKDTSEEVHAE